MNKHLKYPCPCAYFKGCILVEERLKKARKAFGYSVCFWLTMAGWIWRKLKGWYSTCRTHAKALSGNTELTSRSRLLKPLFKLIGCGICVQTQQESWDPIN